MKYSYIALLVAFSAPISAMYYVESALEWSLDKLVERLIPTGDYEEFLDEEIAQRLQAEDAPVIEEIPQDGMKRKERIQQTLRNLFHAVREDDQVLLAQYLESGDIAGWYKDLNLDALTFVEETGEEINAGALLDSLAKTNACARIVQLAIYQSGRRYRLINEVKPLLRESDLLAVSRAFAKHVAGPLLAYNPFTQLFLDEEGSKKSVGQLIEEYSASWNLLYGYITSEVVALYGDRWADYKREKERQDAGEVPRSEVVSPEGMEQLKARVRVCLQSFMHLNPFQEMRAENGKSFGDLIEESDAYSDFTGGRPKQIASQVKLNYPNWDVHKKNQHKQVSLPAVHIPHGVMVAEEELELVQHQVVQDLDEVLVEQVEEELPQKTESIMALIPYKTIAGVCVVTLGTLLLKKYLDSKAEDTAAKNTQAADDYRTETGS